jgi:hypothetical protein
LALNYVGISTNLQVPQYSGMLNISYPFQYMNNTVLHVNQSLKIETLKFRGLEIHCSLAAKPAEALQWHKGDILQLSVGGERIGRG